MLGVNFFKGLILARVDQMCGNLFSRGVDTDRIKAMSYTELTYWNGWHKEMAKRERDTGKVK